VSSKHFSICLDISKMLKNTKLQLDCLLCLGYISFSKFEYEDAKVFFAKAFKVAKILKEPEIAEQCMCNVGRFWIYPISYLNRNQCRPFKGEDDGREFSSNSIHVDIY
jgi:hypothetical protein